MANVKVNIRMDEETKIEFDKFCKEIGLSANTVINIFAKTVVREQRIPFEITTKVPNSTTLAVMDSADNDEETYGPFDSIDALIEALNA